jgi:hypothetical protein
VRRIGRRGTKGAVESASANGEIGGCHQSHEFGNIKGVALALPRASFVIVPAYLVLSHFVFRCTVLLECGIAVSGLMVDKMPTFWRFPCSPHPIQSEARC